MAQEPTLILRNIHPWGESGMRDLAVVAGRFAALEPRMSAERTIDAEGRMAVPGFVEPHIHLDKALISERAPVNVSGTLTEASEILWESKRNYTVDEISDR